MVAGTNLQKDVNSPTVTFEYYTQVFQVRSHPAAAQSKVTESDWEVFASHILSVGAQG